MISSKCLLLYTIFLFSFPIEYSMAYRRFQHVGEDKVTMDLAFFAIAFNIKKLCAKLTKAEKELIALTKLMLIGLCITRYNWKIVICYQMYEKKQRRLKGKQQDYKT